MLPFLVEGDSLAVQMEPALIRHAFAYDAKPQRIVEVGVNRIIARRDRPDRPVLVSLGTADYLFGTSSPVKIAHDARRLLRHHRCVVWKLIRSERWPWGDRGDGGEALNRGLRRVTRLHLVEAVKPDAGDGLHYTATTATIQAQRMRRVAEREC